MGDLSHRDILTVLDRLDLEFTQTLQAKTALQHVRAILTEYETAKQGLAAQAQTRDAMAGEIKALALKYQQEESTQRAALNDHLAPIHRAIADANAAAEKAKARLTTIADEVTKAEAAAAERMAKAMTGITDKEARLASLTAELDDLKRKHRL